MSTESGQLLRNTPRLAASNVIWLPGVYDKIAAMETGQAQGGAPASQAHAGERTWRGPGAIAMLAAATAQAVALMLLIASSGNAEPWPAAAVFGFGAAVAAGFGRLAAVLFNRRLRAAAGANLPYDAVTLALVMAASPFTGAAGALLLLPAIAVFSRVMRRAMRCVRVSEHDVFLLLAVLVALAGLCGSAWHAWIAVAAALTAGTILQSGQTRYAAARLPYWQAWAIPTVLCFAVTATTNGTGGAALAAWPQAALIAGLLYGGGIGIAYNTLNSKQAAMLTAAAPFLAAALECANVGLAPLPQAAAAIVLASALAFSGRKRAPGEAPLARPLNCPG